MKACAFLIDFVYLEYNCILVVLVHFVFFKTFVHLEASVFSFWSFRFVSAFFFFNLGTFSKFLVLVGSFRTFGQSQKIHSIFKTRVSFIVIMTAFNKANTRGVFQNRSCRVQ